MASVADPLTASISSLQATQNELPLHITQAVPEFLNFRLGDEDDTESDNVGFADPTVSAADVAAQITFMRKLKFQYVEQNAKDKYVKYIVNDVDDAPFVTKEDNDILAQANAERKEALQRAKLRLKEKCSDIRMLAPLVEQDYKLAKQQAAQIESLQAKILDARLELTRLRKKHPHPRLTIPTAEQKLEEQVVQMQTLTERQEEVGAKIAEAKERLRGTGREGEKLIALKREWDEKRKTQGVEEDENILPLYEWYKMSIAMNKGIIGLSSFVVPSENELHLTYARTLHSGSKGVAQKPPFPNRDVTIVLIFVPGTRHLAEARVMGMEDIDIEEVVDLMVQKNDVVALVAAVLSRAR